MIDDRNETRHEYISTKEYEAAVKVAASVIKESVCLTSPAPSDE